MGIIPPSESICVLCNSDIEDHNHLLLHCQFSNQLWTLWLDIWNLKWSLPLHIREAFDQWSTPHNSPFFKKVWLAAFFIITWTIWKERNSRIFNNAANSISHLHEMVLLRLGWWITGWKDQFPYSPTDVQRNPSCLLWGGQLCNKITRVIPVSRASWIAPLQNCLKWNVDASAMQNSSRSAIGGVLRDHNGNFICLFSLPIPVMEINSAEVLAIHRAISITLASPRIKKLTYNH
ncbi:uncharacterized protein [Spinacia oleracea]|uniref:RNase H type-1 domain-containing protein n=1 Tax=Spinacia oleracea TaxID=3562 RepID=A0ABM3R487_SPIOL|nr:uncharacterized protein LOC130465608 [Spinacia oleracea]